MQRANIFALLALVNKRKKVSENGPKNAQTPKRRFFDGDGGGGVWGCHTSVVKQFITKMQNITYSRAPTTICSECDYLKDKIQLHGF